VVRSESSRLNSLGSRLRRSRLLSSQPAISLHRSYGGFFQQNKVSVSQQAARHRAAVSSINTNTSDFVTISV
jgi:hypothetical protein